MCSTCDADDTFFEKLALERQVDILRDALVDLRDHGTRHDTRPTMAGGGKNDTLWWYNYIGSADKAVRDIARKAIEDADAIV